MGNILAKTDGVKVSMETKGKGFSHEGDDKMSKVMSGYGTLDLNVLAAKKSRIVSSEEVLKNVKPIEWGDEILRGEKRVIVTKEKE